MKLVRTLVAFLAAATGLWLVTASGRAGAATAAATTRAAGVKVVPVAVSETRYRWLAAGPGKSDYAELKITVNVVGEAAAKAVRFGHVKVTQAVDDKRNSLILPDADKEHSRDYESGFVTIADSRRASVGNGFRAELVPLRPAAREATRIAKVIGSLKLITGGKTAEVTVPNARSLTGIQVNHPALKAAGVTLKIVKPGTSIIPWEDPAKTISFQTEGNVDAVLSAGIVDAAGKAVDCHSSVQTDGGATRQQSLTAEKELPQKPGLKIEVLSGAEVVTVPFELKDVPLP